MNWKSIPLQQRILLGLLLAIIVIWLTVLSIQPLLDRIAANQAKVREIEKIMQSSHAGIDVLSPPKSVATDIQQLADLLPENFEGAQLIKRFYQAPQVQRGLEILRIQPKPVEFGEPLPGENTHTLARKRYQPIEIQFLADFKTATEYLQYLETQDWILRAQKLEINPEQNNPNKLQVKAIYHVILAPENSKYATKEQATAATNDKSNFLAREIYFYGQQPMPNAKTQVSQPALNTLQIHGVIGQRLIIDDELYGIGETVAGWKILKIDFVAGEALFQLDEQSMLLQFEP